MNAAYAHGALPAIVVRVEPFAMGNITAYFSNLQTAMFALRFFRGWVVVVYQRIRMLFCYEGTEGLRSLDAVGVIHLLMRYGTLQHDIAD